MSKYSIGIDLGTTNCVVAYSPLGAESPEIALLPIEQITAPKQTETLYHLPSFLYIPTESESASGEFVIPYQPDYPTVNGVFARTRSAEQPERTIAAAKSWLCHSGVDRHATILPWDSPPEIAKLSPVAATRILLRQLIDSWNKQFAEDPFDQQQVTLTVPASFDMAARELTREAAVSAGLPDGFILLEEPQAAVYHWLDNQGDSWRKRLGEGDTLLVTDVGGGTTDLTLVRVEQEAGDLVLRRLAVGKHLLVGGDNMDLALAHFVAQRFAEQGTRLNAWQSISLWHACRRAKESLLATGGAERETVSVLGRGSKLIGGTVSVEIDRDEVKDLLVDGFLPICTLDDQPQSQPASGLQELGLPFESDSALTRHIASFLATNRAEAGVETESNESAVDGSEAPMADSTEEGTSSGRVHLLLNGGVFKSAALRERLTESVGAMLQSEVPILGGPEDLDHAVARGAAYYGWAKRQGGIRIRGGTARSYYVGIESAGLAVPGMPRPLQALCVVPFGMEEGSELEVPGREVGLVVGRQVQFRFFAAADRKQDAPGDLLKFWDEDELVETAPVEISLDVAEAPEEGFVPVRFQSRVSELGVAELWCKSTRDQQKWKLEFNVREQDEASHS